MIALAAGRPVTNFEGGQPRESVRQWVDALVQQVGPQLSGLDTDGQQPKEEPEDPRLDAATAALNSGDFDAAISIYDDILAGLRRRSRRAVSRAWMISLMTIQVGEGKSRVRNRLLELFGLFDAADPRVVEARTKMASALF